MKDTAYAFAVSAVRVRETKLLSRTQLESLISAPDEAGVLRILEDHGYHGIAEDAEAVLADRIGTVTEFVTDVSPDRELLRFLFIKNDFHNLKAAMKCAMSDADPEMLFLSAVSVSTDAIRTAVSERKFSDLPESLAKPARDAWEALVTGMNGQFCEMILDRAAIEASVKIASDSGDDFSIGLALLRQKLTSFLIAYRCAASGKTGDFVKAALPDQPDPSKDRLVSAALAGCSEITSLAIDCGIPLWDGASAPDIIAVSKELEDEYIGSSAFVSMGMAPLISYYLRAEREISQIRVILSCKRCGFTDDTTRLRAGL